MRDRPSARRSTCTTHCPSPALSSQQNEERGKRVVLPPQKAEDRRCKTGLLRLNPTGGRSIPQPCKTSASTSSSSRTAASEWTHGKPKRAGSRSSLTRLLRGSSPSRGGSQSRQQSPRE